MTVALAGRSPATFEIKSANLPLVSLLLKSADLGLLAGELSSRFGDIPDFFDNDPLVLDLSPLRGGGEIDFDALLHLLRGYKVMPIAVRGGSPQQMAAAVLMGLAVANDLEGLRQAQPERDGGQPEREGARSERDRAESERDRLQSERGGSRSDRDESQSERVAGQQDPGGNEQGRSMAQPEAEGARAAPAPVTALIVDKPLRSGQQVYARGRDLIVMSMVNPGAEVIADGNVHVYAPLRGRAIAGARGNTEARIVSLSLEPELISIAGVYRTSEVPLPAELLGRPAQVRLVGGSEGKLVMDALDMSPAPLSGKARDHKRNT